MSGSKTTFGAVQQTRDTSRDNDNTKICFVTVGATASFVSLIRTVVSGPFIKALRSNHYTDLRVQFGTDGFDPFKEALETLDDASKAMVNITGFEFAPYGLHEEYLCAKRTYPKSQLKGKEGCVISHAGSGSILEALRIALPCIVVPNTDLLENHQAELAEVLAEQDYVVHGKLDDLSPALFYAEKLRDRSKQWPPIGNGRKGEAKVELKTVLDDELGWVD